MLRYNSAASQQQRLEQFLEESFSAKGAQPFSFHYDGKWSRTFLDDWKFEKRNDGVAYTSPDGLVAAVEVRTFEDFPAVEWLLTFENTAETDSKLIEDVNALDLEKIGPAFENHPLFPERVNTEFVRVVGPATLTRY